MRYYESVLELIGNTPLVKLNSVTNGLSATVLAKVEFVNPGGSVKDRIAVRMIDAAEESGALKPGGTIVEATSGNTGIGLALVAQQRGYHCIFVCPDKVSQDKINTPGGRMAPRWWSALDRRSRPRTRAPTTPSPIAWPAKPLTAGSRTSTPTRTTRDRTTRRPGPRYGRPPTAASPTSWPALVPAARCPAWGGTSKEQTTLRFAG